MKRFLVIFTAILLLFSITGCIGTQDMSINGVDGLQTGILGHVASSSQTSYPSPRRQRQVSPASLLVLSPRDPLRWVRTGAR